MLLPETPAIMCPSPVILSAAKDLLRLLRIEHSASSSAWSRSTISSWRTGCEGLPHQHFLERRGRLLRGRYSGPLRLLRLWQHSRTGARGSRKSQSQLAGRGPRDWQADPRTAISTCDLRDRALTSIQACPSPVILSAATCPPKLQRRRKDLLLFNPPS